MTIFHLFIQRESADVKDQTSNLFFYLYSYFVNIILACLDSDQVWRLNIILLSFILIVVAAINIVNDCQLGRHINHLSPH